MKPRRKRLEEMPESKMMNKVIELIGRGRIHVSTAAELVRDSVADGLQSEVLDRFAAFGCHGECPQNTERDVQKWLRGLWNFNLEPYRITLNLQAASPLSTMVLGPRLTLPWRHSLCKHGSFYRMRCSTAYMNATMIRRGFRNIYRVASFLRSSFSSNPRQFRHLLFGDLDGKAVLEFWHHLKGLPAWSKHEFLHNQPDDVLSVTAPITIHADGAEFFRNDEFFVWSFSSALSSGAMVKDPLLKKYPIALVAEREMLDNEAKAKSSERLFPSNIDVATKRCSTYIVSRFGKR